MGRGILPAIFVLGLLLCALTQAATALHWNVGVTYGPTTVFMETDETFTITLRNNGPDPVAVTGVAITFDWVTAGFRYTVSSQAFNLAPANDRALSVAIPIPRLVAGSEHSLSVFVTAQTNGDLVAEEKEFTGHVTAVEGPSSSAVFGGLLLCGAGIIVGVVVLILVILLIVRRRAPARPMMPPMVPPLAPMAPGGAHSGFGPSQPCPTCGRALTFISQYQRWYCSAENKYT